MFFVVILWKEMIALTNTWRVSYVLKCYAHNCFSNVCQTSPYLMQYCLYTFQACMKSCYQSHVMSECSCGDPTMPMEGAAVTKMMADKTIDIEPCNTTTESKDHWNDHFLNIFTYNIFTTNINMINYICFTDKHAIASSYILVYLQLLLFMYFAVTCELGVKTRFTNGNLDCNCGVSCE